MKPGRVPCLVPFCRCTVPEGRHPPGSEVICQKHWRAVSKREKAFLRMVRRALRRTLDPQGRERLLQMDDRAWARCRKDAIEKAAGI